MRAFAILVLAHSSLWAPPAPSWGLSLDAAPFSSRAHPSARFSAPFAAVSISDSLGFVALLSSTNAPQRVCPVAVSRRDTERVVSAEAHTLLQLLQGIDAGTAVLPPNALTRAFVAHDGLTPYKLALAQDPSLELRAVSVRPKKDDDAANTQADPVPDTQQRCSPETAARRAPALSAAFAQLGVPLSHEEGVALLLRYSIDGELTRETFSKALADARDETTKTDALVQATLVATDGREVETSNFVGLALALRYQTPIVVDDALFEIDGLALDADDALDKFPLLKSVEDLKYDGLVLEAHSKRLFDDAAAHLAAATTHRGGAFSGLSVSSSSSSFLTTPEDDEEGPLPSADGDAPRPPFRPSDHFGSS